MKRRLQVLLRPLDARLVDVAASQLGLLGFSRELCEHASGAAAEVERALSPPVPASRQAGVDTRANLGSDLVPVCPWIGRVELPDTAREAQRRAWRHPHGAESTCRR